MGAGSQRGLAVVRVWARRVLIFFFKYRLSFIPLRKARIFCFAPRNIFPFFIFYGRQTILKKKKTIEKQVYFLKIKNYTIFVYFFFLFCYTKIIKFPAIK